MAKTIKKDLLPSKVSKSNKFENIFVSILSKRRRENNER